MSKPLSQNQKTFNKVYKHLIKQGKKSVGEHGSCLYRGQDGTKCAVGCLIPDRLYNKDIEHKSAVFRTVRNVLEQLGHDPSFCQELQMIHDNRGVASWPNELEVLAEKYSLKVPQVPAIKGAK